VDRKSRADEAESMMRRCAALFVSALLTACATVPQGPLPSDVTALRQFELSGRVAAQVENRGYSARLRWRHDGARDSLRLYSPVGSVLATITADSAGASLVTADRKQFTSPDVQGLTRQVLGWDLPLSGLQHWVVARPDPEAPIDYEARDERGRLQQLRQSGWEIVYTAYASDSALPSAMALRHGDLKLKLKIDRWNTEPTRLSGGLRSAHWANFARVTR
jgi:outer membrane lipoprotein LolB